VRHRVFLNSKDKLPLNLTLKAAKRTQNATGAVVKDNGLIIGSNPAAGHPGWDEIGAITEVPELR